jgi:hypothetical protein
MRILSQANLIKNAVVDKSGAIINKLFESRYVSLNIKVNNYSMIRGKVLVADINEILDEQKETNPSLRYFKFSLEQLINLLYVDFLRQAKKQEYSLLFQSILLQQQKWIDKYTSKTKKIKNIYANHYSVEEIKTPMENNFEIITINILKDHVLRGEILLHDLSEKYPGFKVSLEEILAYKYEEIISEVKNGNHAVLNAIIQNIAI